MCRPHRRNEAGLLRVPVNAVLRQVRNDDLPTLLPPNELHRELNASAPLKFVNTSMHGVSHVFMVEAFKSFGFEPFTPVAEQQNPDPEFPTVKFPNPEEAGMIIQ